MINIQVLRTRIVFVGMTILLFYLSYRYPFQINFSGTSPTYSDTPFVLQVSKFLIALFFCFLLGWFKVSSVRVNIFNFLALLSLLHLLLVIKGVVFQQLEFVEIPFWFFCALLFSLHCSSISFFNVEKFIKIVFVVSLIFNVFQIVLFFVYGRLPALAYEGTFSIRFGSFLDDPNGFAALCFLLFGWSLYLDSRIARFLCCTIASLMIILTQSLTAILFLCVLCSLLGLKRLLLNESLISKLSVFLCFILALLLLLYFQSFLIDFYEMKQASIGEHVDIDFDSFFDGALLTVFFGGVDFVFYESGWVSSLFNMGFLWFILFLFLQFYVLTMLYVNFKKARSKIEMRIFSAILIFSSFFTFGSINLPFWQVFPVNFFYYFFSLSAIVGFSNDVRGENEVDI